MLFSVDGEMVEIRLGASQQLLVSGGVFQVVVECLEVLLHLSYAPCSHQSKAHAVTAISVRFGGSSRKKQYIPEADNTNSFLAARSMLFQSAKNGAAACLVV